MLEFMSTIMGANKKIFLNQQDSETSGAALLRTAGILYCLTGLRAQIQTFDLPDIKKCSALKYEIRS